MYDNMPQAKEPRFSHLELTENQKVIQKHHISRPLFHYVYIIIKRSILFSRERKMLDRYLLIPENETILFFIRTCLTIMFLALFVFFFFRRERKLMTSPVTPATSKQKSVSVVSFPNIPAPVAPSTSFWVPMNQKPKVIHSPPQRVITPYGDGSLNRGKGSHKEKDFKRLGCQKCASGQHIRNDHRHRFHCEACGRHIIGYYAYKKHCLQTHGVIKDQDSIKDTRESKSSSKMGNEKYGKY
ncbi:hypothetical protein G9A89_010199 [Geosiphon pyriformis]|nr:hypothetical protein G9A89_010199 [Geosiphon pyriformis]